MTVDRAMAPAGCINLTFHGIGEPVRPLSQGERDVWVSDRQFESILDAVEGHRDVTITFDDGNLSDVAHALPALRRRGLRGTFFIVAGKLGEEGFVDEADVRALAEADMTIGCHGHAHRGWRSLSDHELEQELLDSKRRLEKVAGRPVTQAACPFGLYDRRVLHRLKGYGYERVFTSDRGMARADAWLQPRNTIRPQDGDDPLEEIRGLDASITAAAKRRAKLAVKRWR
jgi:peptidoglycan/xylan/chitin deacetylase (PgdA/CDA1 family)